MLSQHTPPGGLVHVPLRVVGLLCCQNALDVLHLPHFVRKILVHGVPPSA